MQDILAYHVTSYLELKDIYALMLCNSELYHRISKLLDETSNFWTTVTLHRCNKLIILKQRYHELHNMIQVFRPKALTCSWYIKLDQLMEPLKQTNRPKHTLHNIHYYHASTILKNFCYCIRIRPGEEFALVKDLSQYKFKGSFLV